MFRDQIFALLLLQLLPRSLILAAELETNLGADGVRATPQGKSMYGRTLASPDLCGHTSRSRGNLVGRFCHRYPGVQATRWFDLCYYSSTAAYFETESWPVDAWPPQTLRNGLGPFHQINIAFFDEHTGLNPARLPTLATGSGARRRIYDKLCPHGYHCAQFIDADRDAHIRCVKDAAFPRRAEDLGDELVWAGTLLGYRATLPTTGGGASGYADQTEVPSEFAPGGEQYDPPPGQQQLAADFTPLAVPVTIDRDLAAADVEAYLVDAGTQKVIAAAGLIWASIAGQALTSANTHALCAPSATGCDPLRQNVIKKGTTILFHFFLNLAALAKAGTAMVGLYVSVLQL